MKSSTNKRKIEPNIFFVLGILFIVLLWNFGANYFNNDYIVPSVEETLVSLRNLLTKSYIARSFWIKGTLKWVL